MSMFKKLHSWHIMKFWHGDVRKINFSACQCSTSEKFSNLNSLHFNVWQDEVRHSEIRQFIVRQGDVQRVEDRQRYVRRLSSTSRLFYFLF